MSTASQKFCLILDPETQLDIPVQVAENGLRFVELDEDRPFAYQARQLKHTSTDDGAVHFKTITVNGTLRKLFFERIDSQLRVRVNGSRVARWTLLHSGDVLDLDDLTFHVSLLNQPYIGPPEPSHVGRKCGYCRVKIEDSDEMRIYACPKCGFPTHFQDDHVPPETRLECAKASSQCGHCQADIIASEGFTHVPVF